MVGIKVTHLIPGSRPLVGGNTIPSENGGVLDPRSRTFALERFSQAPGILGSLAAYEWSVLTVRGFPTHAGFMHALLPAPR